MKKLFAAGVAALLLAVTANSALACTYKQISVDSDGTVRGRWIPCQNPDCPDFQRHFEAIEKEQIHVDGKVMSREEYREYQKKEQEKIRKSRFGFADLDIEGEKEAAKEEKQAEKKADKPKEAKQIDPETTRQKPARSVDVKKAEKEAIDRVCSEIIIEEEKPKKKNIFGKIFG